MRKDRQNYGNNKERRDFKKDDRQRDRALRGGNFLNKINQETENIIEGRNPVIEAIKSGRTIEKIYVSKGDVEGSIKMIISMAKERGIVISEVERKRLDEMSTTMAHQGVIAIVSDYNYVEVDEILKFAKQKNEDPFIIILDEIEDPHNLGSIIRSANVFGAHGVIIPKRRSALVTATVAKASAGAIEHTKIAKVTNLNKTIDELKEMGLWIAALDMDGENCYNKDLNGPLAIVIGSEGRGVSRLVKQNCDFVVKIPMKGEISSLNASVAAGVIMYEVIKQRGI
ncbi:putative TrmH family tRNA/rRNA methyltransferase [Caloramator mitchellensis]|uniref:Putative TrmH family tRNA/rRNA methyltransferase n=1 Tax=Caloramator mitchellensis TaxID=908809 RepID=A0A0R3JSF8_CALMK|nr:23S rRNA (guanosine(2251)-2'-O)-methyltransferase RlmB [Caloramator mitchellensis]KRQ86439.1 putative TrmH family tRNA/rRNA methyltransferase [Caloramator mitchellensis]